MVASPAKLSLPPRPLTTTVTVGASGPAAADEVWLRYATPSRWHEWSPQISRVDCSSPDAVVVAGLSGTVSGPLGARVRFAVTGVDESARRWTWRVRVGLLDLVMAHGVDSLPGGGDAVPHTEPPLGVRHDGERVRAWVALTGALPVVAAYAPAARLALGRLVARSAS